MRCKTHPEKIEDSRQTPLRTNSAAPRLWDFKRKLTTFNWLCLGKTPWQRPSSPRPRAGCCAQKKVIGHCEFPSRAQATPTASLFPFPNRFAKPMAHVSFNPMFQNHLFESGRQRPQARWCCVQEKRLCSRRGSSSEDLTKFAVCRPLFFLKPMANVNPIAAHSKCISPNQSAFLGSFRTRGR